MLLNLCRTLNFYPAHSCPLYTYLNRHLTLLNRDASPKVYVIHTVCIAMDCQEQHVCKANRYIYMCIISTHNVCTCCPLICADIPLLRHLYCGYPLIVIYWVLLNNFCTYSIIHTDRLRVVNST